MTHADRQYGKRKAVLWAADGSDDHGYPVVSSDGVEIDVVAWEEGRREQVNENGEVVAYDTSCVVFQDIAEGSCLRLGDLDDVPDPVNNVRQVINYSETPSVNRKSTHRTVTMTRLTSLPTED